MSFSLGHMGTQQAVRFAGGYDEQRSWFSPSNGITRIVGFSFVATLLRKLLGGQSGTDAGSSSYLMDSIILFLLGTVLEGGRRFFSWAIDRFKLFEYSINAQFTEGDPVYEWIIHFMTEEKIWTRSRQFHVAVASSLRQWAVSIEGKKIDGHIDDYAEYVPTYEKAQLFRWGGYWMEVQRGSMNRRNNVVQFYPNGGSNLVGKLSLTIYTRDMKALSKVVGEARKRYVETSRPHVVVHTIDQATHMNPGSPWSNSKAKARRPLNSIILQEGVINSLIEDASEFIKSESWYTAAGIPHRRGYLLYGPPGTGKSSTIYAVAGELGLEIYSLSLASGFVDDSFLARAVSSIPKRSIFLIEDIDCAFSSREDDDSDSSTAAASMAMQAMNMGFIPGPRRSRSTVTLSGLLNVLDGVGSEEGKLFFATTNYVDRLDPALLRPGRIDMKIQYKLATKAQAAALFLRFYPIAQVTLKIEKHLSLNAEKSTVIDIDEAKKTAILHELSEKFAEAIPDHEFSTAELQGYLLSCKREPEKATSGAAVWVEREILEKKERAKREEQRIKAQKEKKASFEPRQLGKHVRFAGNMSKGAHDVEENFATPTAMEPKLSLAAVKEDSVDLLSSGAMSAFIPKPQGSVNALPSNGI